MKEYKTKEQVESRIKFLKDTLEEKMPSVINAIRYGFTPANYKLYENYAQEYFNLLETLKTY